MPKRVALIHYHEIGLKGRNRGDFEQRFQRNLRFAVRGLDVGPVKRLASRYLMALAEADVEEALEAIASVPGVAYVADAWVCARDPEEMERTAIAVIASAAPAARTFGIKARRSATDHPEPSFEIARRIGSAVRAALGLEVDLTDPDVWCHVDVVRGDVFVYARRIEGPGGLPVGTSGRMVALLSAGIDSPVAAWRMIRRGAVVTAVHFSGRPQTDGRSEGFAREICHVLQRTGGLSALQVVPFGDVQRAVALTCPPDLRVLLYRRLMVRIAERIARRERAKALITGESLGQVASQTLENIAAIDAVAALPVFRPLIGHDKQEIMREARAIGTFEISTRPHEDCCTLFMPRTPETHASIEELDAAEALVDVPALVEQALAGAWVEPFECVVPRRTPRSDEEALSS